MEFEAQWTSHSTPACKDRHPWTFPGFRLHGGVCTFFEHAHTHIHTHEECFWRFLGNTQKHFILFYAVSNLWASSVVAQIRLGIPENIAAQVNDHVDDGVQALGYGMCKGIHMCWHACLLKERRVVNSASRCQRLKHAAQCTCVVKTLSSCLFISWCCNTCTGSTGHTYPFTL